MEFPKHIEGTLHMRDRVLEIKQKDDLLEVLSLSDLQDERHLVLIDNIMYDFNLFKQNDGFKLVMYTTHQRGEDDAYCFNPNEFKNVKLTIDER